MASWKTNPAMDLDLAGEDVDWDGDKAKDQIFRWAGGDDDFDPVKARKAFFAYDADNPDEKQSYKLPFAYVRSGKLVAIPHAIHAVAAVLEGGRGGVDLPQTVKQEIRKKVEKYYKKMGDEAPW